MGIARTRNKIFMQNTKRTPAEAKDRKDHKKKKTALVNQTQGAGRRRTPTGANPSAVNVTLSTPTCLNEPCQMPLSPCKHRLPDCQKSPQSPLLVHTTPNAPTTSQLHTPKDTLQVIDRVGDRRPFKGTVGLESRTSH